MKWAHLPEEGGIYQQHPLLIDRFYFLMAAVAEQQEKERKAEKNRGMGPTRKPSMGARGRPRR